MAENFASAGILIIQTFAGLYFIVTLVRFLMQVSRVDYYNPICQGIVKITDPPIKPLKRLIPAVRGVDFATLIVALVVQLVAISLIMLIAGQAFFHPVYLAWALIGMFSTILTIYFWALIIMVIASWIAPGSGHPAMALVYQLTDPICEPARKLLPPMGGIDFSIILVFLAITIIRDILVVAPIAREIGVPAGLIMGL